MMPKTTKKKTTKQQVDAAKDSHVLSLEQQLRVPKVLKKKGFTTEEDLFIARAVVNTTLDPVKGCAQRASTYWNSCHAMYDLLCQQEGAPTQSKPVLVKPFPQNVSNL